MPQGGTPLVVPPNPGLVTRVGQAARYVIASIKPDTWMSPLQPLLPLGQEVRDRAFDFKVGYNIDYIPRIGHPVGFGQLHLMSRACSIVRLLIETRKDQVSALSYNFGFKDPTKKKAKDPRIDAITEFFLTPDKVHDFHDWMRAILEELFVTDAVTLYRRKTKGGQLYALDQISGMTIKPLIDDTGRRPAPPGPAYQQILKGVPKSDYSTDEMLYAPRNTIVETPYGFSPLEQLYIYAQILAEGSRSQLAFFTYGSLPDGFLTVAKDWSADQISSFGKSLNDLLSGNLEERRRLPPMPNGVEWHEVKPPPLKSDSDEWFVRIACFAFSLPPTAFIKQMNRSTSETAQDAAKDEGLQPLLLWIKRKIDYIIAVDFKAPDLEFNWNLQVEMDPTTQADVAKTLTSSGIKAINEIRADMGLDPVTGGDEPMLATPTGWMGLPGSDVESQQDARELEMRPPPPAIAPPGGKPTSGDPEQDVPPADGKGKKTPKKPSTKVRKAGGHKPIPFDHSALTGPAKAIRTMMAAALTEAKKATLAHIRKHPVIKRSPAYALDLIKADDDDKQAAANAAAAAAIAAEIDLSSMDIVEDITPELEAAANAAGQYILSQLKVGDKDVLTTLNELAADWASDHAAELITQINETTRDLIQDTITEALDTGMSNAELATELEEEYGFSSERADLIAVTETNNAANHGTLQGGYAMQKNGNPVKKMWLESEDPCPICEENADDGEIDLDEDFSSGDDAPLAHPNCLCTLNIIPQDEKDDDEEDEE